jgi:hypothetical protein
MKMTPEVQQKWESAAWALKETVEKLPIPFHVLAGEALDVTRFCQRNWEPAQDRTGQVIRPGLKSAVRNGTFNENIATELLELHDVLQAAQTRYQLLVSGPGAAPMERAQFVLSELRSTLEWYFDDNVEDEADAQLEQLIAAHDTAFSHDAVAAALFDFAALAEKHREAIAGLGGFDVALLDEAPTLAFALRERSAGPATIGPAPAENEALELRNRLGVLLYNRMQQVRQAARFVFRGHQALTREVTSAYARRQRAAHRAQNPDATTPVPSNPSAAPSTSPAAPAVPAADGPAPQDGPYMAG